MCAVYAMCAIYVQYMCNVLCYVQCLSFGAAPTVVHSEGSVLHGPPHLLQHDLLHRTVKGRDEPDIRKHISRISITSPPLIFLTTYFYL